MSDWDGTERRVQKRVLIIDDDSDLCRLFEIQAKSSGVLIYSAKTPYQFIEQFESGVYDVALVDFGLQDYSGVDLLRLLHREAAPKTKLYLFTHYDLPYVKESLEDTPVDGVVEKSGSFLQILAKISCAMGV